MHSFSTSLIWILLLAFNVSSIQAQVSYTANDSVPEFNGEFGYGANVGYYPGWQDEQLGTIAAGDPSKNIPGAGVTTFRPALFEHFLEQYGYESRVATFQHYYDLGMRDLTVFIGYPSPAHREQESYCPNIQSETFANLYTEIWDGGKNGTPYNDENYFARYVYKTVSLYKDYVKFWEIWNEPDFDYSNNAWKTKMIPGNWWNNDPEPCQYALRAPPTQYIRMLRIAYEVIKTVDPHAFVAVGGLGFPSFLNFVLNHTDNPDDGKITEAFPLKGGAYFDAMSFHSYPHIDGSMRKWSNLISGFEYSRHSDAAVAGVLRLQNEFRELLAQYGYDDHKYPTKKYIITESNIPKKGYQDFIGSQEAQTNFIIKALVKSQANDILQFFIYNLGEEANYEDAKSEFQLMGLYENLLANKPFTQTPTPLAIAFKSTSDLLRDKKYSADLTQDLSLSDNIDGGVFTNNNAITFVLWAKTKTDQSEVSEAIYSIPDYFTFDELEITHWNFAMTKKQIKNRSRTLKLSASPLFISFEKKNNRKKELGCNFNPYSKNIEVLFNLKEDQPVRLEVFDSQGKLIFEKFNGEILKPGIYNENVNIALENDEIFVCSIEIGEKVFINRVAKISN